MALLLLIKPVWLVIIYAVAGAFFMPLMAVLLLYMNNRRSWVGGLANRLSSNAVLLMSVLVFSLLLVTEISKYM
jgi:hypothetical protein